MNAGNLCNPLNDDDGDLKCSMACIDKDYDDRYKIGQNSLTIFDNLIFALFYIFGDFWTENIYATYDMLS